MPFVWAAVFEDLALMIEHDALNFWLDFETIRDARQAIDDCSKCFLTDRRGLRLARVLRLKNGRRFSESGFLVRPSFFDRVDFVAGHFQSQTELRFKGSRVVFAQCPGFNQLVLVNLRDRRAFLNL